MSLPPADPTPLAPVVKVDLTSPVPPYEQLRAQVAGLVASGDLAPNCRLPTVRQLAADLGLAAGTVARAYRELMEQGVLIGKGRHGTYVRGREPDRAAQRALAVAAERVAQIAAEFGLGQDSAVAAVRQACARLPRS